MTWAVDRDCRPLILDEVRGQLRPVPRSFTERRNTQSAQCGFHSCLMA